MRGEYVVNTAEDGSDAGSPPLAWGIPWAWTCPAIKTGITPTCVGNTSCQHTATSLHEDHPHLRGEYSASPVSASTRRGSPPLAWGILPKPSLMLEQSRITPTCVGNTAKGYGYRLPRRDHPHLRGEYSTSQRRASLMMRITPTCVGNT